jgi:hypothetical protein
MTGKVPWGRDFYGSKKKWTITEIPNLSINDMLIHFHFFIMSNRLPTISQFTMFQNDSTNFARSFL